MAVDVFVSYSRKDERLIEELRTYLDPLRRQGRISLWYDKDVLGGHERKAEIDEKLSSADLILLGISADFLASEYCYVQLSRAVERRKHGDVEIAPIILRPCVWKSTPVSRYQLLPSDGKSVTRWADRGEAFVDVVEGIQRIIEEIERKKALLFSLLSVHAQEVVLCLFDDAESSVERRIPLERSEDDEALWSARVAGISPGQLYGYRVKGPWDPARGYLFNPEKLLVDPMAKAITGEPDDHPSLLAFSSRGETPSSADSAPSMPRCVVVDPEFDWKDDRSPRVPWADTVIYECHVRGLTKRHPEISPEERGTYLGLVAPPVLAHLRSLGVTTLLLMPVQQIATEPDLRRLGLRNYWGYSPLGFCAPHAGYASGHLGEQVSEFKTMVRELHAAGLEVILDVVFNHTAEGDHTGPVLSFKGIDNRTYYCLEVGDPSRYVNDTGCGNTLDVRQRVVRRLILESLRYWVEEMHVDGFYFNLAPVLGRRETRSGGYGFGADAAFFQEIAADPVLQSVKLVAEPWSVGKVHLGGFPRGWGELNGEYRDRVRRFWRGDQGSLGEFTTGLGGSSTTFETKGPLSSINCITHHSGFTLADLVSYSRKHNELNGLGDGGGDNENLSCNWGREGPTDDLDIHASRERAKRNFVATLMLSKGVPLLLHGDEIGRTQSGNNNTYCQDNEMSWTNWSFGPAEARFLDFVRHVVRIRRRYMTWRQEEFATPEELTWWHAGGYEMRPSDWQDPKSQAVAGVLKEGPKGAAAGYLFLLFNSSDSTVAFKLPAKIAEISISGPEASLTWLELINTSLLDCIPRRSIPRPVVEVEAFSMRVYAVEYG